VLEHDLDHHGQERVQDLHGVVRVQAVGERREAPEIGEQDGRLALLAADREVALGVPDDLRGDGLGDVAPEQRAQELVPKLQLALEPLDPEQRGDPGLELHEVEGLPEEVVGAGVQARDAGREIGDARDQDQGRELEAGIALEPPAQLHAAHPVHVHVGEDEVGGNALQHRQRGLRRARRQHLVAQGAELGHQDVPERRVVVDHEQRRHAEMIPRA
jgi:hypothetical protein